jgi:deoxyribonuclease-4
VTAKPSSFLLPRIGAHVSVAGGVAKALARARTIGAEAIQIFAGNPRQWRRPAHAPQDLRAGGDLLRQAGLPVFVHTIYLINLASPDPGLREQSASALAAALVFGARIGGAGVVTHIGSHRGAGFEKAVGWATGALTDALTRARRELADSGDFEPERLPPLRLEASAGSAGSVGANPAELGRILRDLPADAGVCLDTAHLFAAGFAIHTSAGLAAFLEDLERHVGLERVGPIHLNDSKSDLGSRSDRHENLWQGKIGRSGLTPWVRHPAFQRVCFLLETPGFDQQGPDRKNLRRAKRMRVRG